MVQVERASAALRCLQQIAHIGERPPSRAGGEMPHAQACVVYILRAVIIRQVRGAVL